MQQKPFYSFSSTSETGLEDVPVNSIIQIEDSTDPKYIILLNQITDPNLTIGNFLINNTNDYEYLSSGFLHEYDPNTHTLTIIMPLPDITDFNATDNLQNVIDVSFTQNGGEQYDLYNGNTLLVSNIPVTRTGPELNTLNYSYTPPTGGGVFSDLKVKSTFRNYEIWSNSNPGTALDDPSPITNLVASDNQINQVTVTWNNSVGNPTPTQDLWTGPVGNRVKLASNVSSPYIDTFVGTRNYFVVATNNSGSITSNEDNGTGYLVPGTITDFNASDNLSGKIQVTWTSTTGVPTPTYDLWDDNGIIQYNISSGFDYFYTGTKNLHVQAVNAATPSPNGVDSNTDSGTGATLSLYPRTTTIVALGVEDEASVRQAIIDEYGSNATILDWDDLVTYYNINGNFGDLERIPYGISDHYYGGVTKGGVFWSGTSGGQNRNYFIAEDGVYHQSSFASFGSIGPGEGTHGGSLADLGTWYGAREYYVKFI